MSPKQEAFYWRLWSNACAAQGWERKDDEHRHGVHAAALGRDKSHKAFTNREFDRVKAKLEQLANPDSVTAQMGVDAYENADASPRAMPGTHYGDLPEADDPGERCRLIWRIRDFARELGGDPYVLRVCKNMFHTARWEEIPISSLAILRDAMSQRVREHRKLKERDALTAPTAPDAPELVEDDNCPF